MATCRRLLLRGSGWVDYGAQRSSGPSPTPRLSRLLCLSHGKEGGGGGDPAAIRLRAAATDPACSSATTTTHLDPRSTAGRPAGDLLCSCGRVPAHPDPRSTGGRVAGPDLLLSSTLGSL